MYFKHTKCKPKLDKHIKAYNNKNKSRQKD